MHRFSWEERLAVKYVVVSPSGTAYPYTSMVGALRALMDMKAWYFLTGTRATLAVMCSPLTYPSLEDEREWGSRH